MRSQRLKIALLPALLLATASCGGERITAPVAPGPVPKVAGTLLVSFEAGGGPAGAVMVRLRGPGIGAPEVPDATMQLFVRTVDAAAVEYRVAVIGTQLSGTLFSFAVPDVNYLGAYSVTLEEVADESNAIRQDLSGYRLLLARQP
jgi:hypothetical protein